MENTFEEILNLAKAGNITAQRKAGITYLKNDKEEEYAKALYWLQKAYDGGDKCAAAFLADIYYYGKGVENDYTLAFKYATEASADNWIKGIYLLAVFYVDGVCVEQDLCYAKKLLEGIAEQYEDAKHLLIGIDSLLEEEADNGKDNDDDDDYDDDYDDDIDDNDEATSASAFSDTAVAENIETEEEIEFCDDWSPCGEGYEEDENGDLVNKNFQKAEEIWDEGEDSDDEELKLKAVKYYEHAYKQGEREAAYRIGLIYYYGMIDGACDYEEAAIWFKKSVEKWLEKPAVGYHQFVVKSCKMLGDYYMHKYYWNKEACFDQAVYWYDKGGWDVCKGKALQTSACYEGVYNKKGQAFLNEAICTYKKAIENGEEKSYAELGQLYYLYRDYINDYDIFGEAVDEKEDFWQFWKDGIEHEDYYCYYYMGLYCDNKGLDQAEFYYTDGETNNIGNCMGKLYQKLLEEGARQKADIVYEKVVGNHLSSNILAYYVESIYNEYPHYAAQPDFNDISSESYVSYTVANALIHTAINDDLDMEAMLIYAKHLLVNLNELEEARHYFQMAYYFGSWEASQILRQGEYKGIKF